MNLNFTYTDRKTLIQKTELHWAIRQKLSIPTEAPLTLTPTELKSLTASTLKAYAFQNNSKTRQAIQQVLSKILAAGEDSFSRHQPKTTADHENLVTFPGNDTSEGLARLSPYQVSHLLNLDWSPDTPGVQLRPEATTSDVTSTGIIQWVTAFTKALGKKGTRSTQAGNLNRKFVDLIVVDLGLKENLQPLYNRRGNVINESDAPSLLFFRLGLESAGIIERRKGRFRITGYGAELLQPGNESNLYHHLFVTWFQQLDLAFWDGYLGCPHFQETFGYSFYGLSVVKFSDYRKDQFLPPLLLPAVVVDFAKMDDVDVATIVEYRFFRQLGFFGLVDLKFGPSEVSWEKFERVIGFRKTRLFDQYITFGI